MHSPSLHGSTIASLQPALSPRLQRAVRLLQMSSQDFAQVVRDALDTNPFLEQEDLPAGVFELKYFFSRGLATASGGECSPTAIRGLIQEMIATETPGQPLSDVEIARELSRQGLQVARRTVAKYRQLLRIEPAERRRARSADAGGPGKGDAHGF